MIQNFSYHTHSTYSDGQDSLESMVIQAINLGWKEIGFSDHLTVHDNMKKSLCWHKMQQKSASFIYRDNFDEAIEHFIKYKAEIRRLEREYPIKIYCGAEVDYYPAEKWKKGFEYFCRDVNLDYYITGNHFLIDENNQVIDPDYLDDYHYSEDKINGLLKHHFEIMVEAVESGYFCFLAHLDYMRRVKLCRSEAFREEKLKVIEALSKQQMATELSTKGIIKFGECFPCPWILAELIERQVPIIISDDAHATTQLGRNFAKAEALLAQYPQVKRWRLE